MFTKILSFFTDPLADIVGGWQARKTLAVEHKKEIALAKHELKITKLLAKTRQVQKDAENDQTYDMQVLKNRQGSWTDEFIIITWFVVFIASLCVPVYYAVKQGRVLDMGQVWASLSSAPWWFEFGMVGILVSTLGLMRVLRLMLGKAKEQFLKGKNQ